MVENQKNLQRFSIVVAFVEGQDDIYENLNFVEFVLEKKLMLENCQVLENQVGRNRKIFKVILKRFSGQAWEWHSLGW